MRQDYIFSLHVKQFLSHLDLEMLFQNVPTLCHLDMTYGVKSIGMHCERTLALARARARTRTRTLSLALTRPLNPNQAWTTSARSSA